MVVALDAPRMPSEVALVAWPSEDALRHRLARQQLPRLLLVPQGTPPPDLLDELEDWLSEPAGAAEVEARMLVLRRRAHAGAGASRRPTIDDDGLLRVAERWVVIPDAQLEVAQLLVDQMDHVVALPEIVATYARTGGSAHEASIRTLINRLGHRFEAVGLYLIRVRRRGVVLSATAPVTASVRVVGSSSDGA